MRKAFLFLVVLAFPLICSAQPDTRPEILVLGTYHMANPGHDIFNMQADDVLAPKRQQEIEQVIAVLKQFHPTKIAIESDIFSEQRKQQYSDYLAGKHTLSRNEIDQIGFRLAKELGHQTIYPVDVDGDFPMLRVSNWAKANGRADKLDSITAGWGAMVREQGEFLRSHTVLEMLGLMNSDDHVTKDLGLYFATVPFGEPGDYAAADLLASWYQRNIRIYQNVVKLIDSPNDKILVIYGAGHLGWLRQDVANDSTVRLRKLSDFTENKK
jgi:hypothetical protein